MGKKIKGILFDLGNTLLNFGPVDIPALFEAGGRLAHEHLKQMGFQPPPFDKFHRRQLWAIRWNVLKSRLTRRELNSLDLIIRLGRRMGMPLTRQQAIEQAWLWYEPLSCCASKEEGLLELLREFSQAGIVLGLVSNTFIPAEVLDRHLAREGLLDLLAVRVYSCEVGYRKPHPRIFAEALARGKLRAEETLFVGDSMRADIYGARRAGLIPVLKAPAETHRNSKITTSGRIHKLGELREFLAACDA